MGNTFKRIEQKYLLTKQQSIRLVSLLNEYMKYDIHCKNGKSYHVQNLYYDTLDNSLIRTSISKPLYKEKVRVRKYNHNSELYLEVKKKYDGIVGKRRLEISKEELDNFVNFHNRPIRTSYIDNQTINEFAYLFEHNEIVPKVYIAYDRVGFFSEVDPDFRLTLDRNIYANRNDFSWEQDKKGTLLINDNQVLMEIKLSKGYPLWLVSFLSKEQIYPISFSKYGTEYNLNIKEYRNV